MAVKAAHARPVASPWGAGGDKKRALAHDLKKKDRAISPSISLKLANSKRSRKHYPQTALEGSGRRLFFVNHVFVRSWGVKCLKIDFRAKSELFAWYVGSGFFLAGMFGGLGGIYI